MRYANKPIDKPHLFLNEARMSAIAISIYLGMIKRHVQGIPCKVLFLDDIFIGLDIANRLPLLSLLEIETYRQLVLNAFSHYNTERHEIKTELESAIMAIDKLKQELTSL